METPTVETQFMFFTLYTVVGIFGLIGNALTFFTFWKERRRSVFHMQLAVANIVTLSSTFLSAPSALRGRWLFGDPLCQWFGFQVFIVGFAELALTCTICIETYTTVCRPDDEKTPSKTVLSIVSVVVWGYALIFSLAPLFGWNSYKHESLGISCGIDIENNTPSNYSYLVITHIFFVVMAVPGFVCLMLTLLRKPGGSKVYQPLLSDSELVRVTFLLFTFICLGCLPYYLRVVYFLRGFPPFFDSFLGVEFSHIAMKVCCLLQPIAYMIVSENFRKVAFSAITGVDPVKKNA
ncbi:melanopsin-like [Mercenaria mercenaria]|uniref:melanopsin-like n=1 Tax=Mercenaria mercenaria TaxID=6596 RepID=UPI00234E7DD7|nr:melanopsin-like [Mercenaria mercenaria]